jgi:hypothetical protein
MRSSATLTASCDVPSKPFMSAANNLAAGRAFMAISAEAALTPAKAAELLGLSRPIQSLWSRPSAQGSNASASLRLCSMMLRMNDLSG